MNLKNTSGPKVHPAILIGLLLLLNVWIIPSMRAEEAVPSVSAEGSEEQAAPPPITNSTGIIDLFNVVIRNDLDIHLNEAQVDIYLDKTLVGHQSAGFLSPRDSVTLRMPIQEGRLEFSAQSTTGKEIKCEGTSPRSHQDRHVVIDVENQAITCRVEQ